MKKYNRILVTLLVFLLTFSVLPNYQFTTVVCAWEIDGDKVFINDSNVYLSAQPHTIIDSTWVEFELISKQYTGDIDVVWGFNHSVVRPKQPQRWNGTAYIPMQNNFIIKNHEWGGCNKWYILKEVPIVEDVLYKVRGWMQLQFNTTGKYWFAVKPSSETLQQAIANGHLYCLDPWWNSSWNFYKPVNINHNYIDTGLSGFPLLVVVPTDIGSKCQSNGEDIRFVSMDNTTEFDYEIESWDGSGDSFVWVNISETIPSENDYTFLCYYNNSEASDNQNPTDVWDENYVAVYHGADWNDTTSNYYNLSIAGSPWIATSQKIGSSFKFDGYDHGDFASCSSFYNIYSGTKTYTIEMWIKIMSQSIDNRYSGIHWNHKDVGVTPMVGLIMGQWQDGPDTFRAIIFDETGVTSIDTDQNNVMYSWYYLAGTYSETDVYIRRNDTYQNSATGLSKTFGGITNSNLRIARNTANDPDDYFDGYIDEIRMSSCIRNESWFNASFHNQNQSTHLGSFLTWGIRKEIGNITVLNHYPVNGSTGLDINPVVNVTVKNTADNSMDIIWSSNSSGSWILFGTNNSVKMTGINLSATGDSYVSQANPTTNYGSSTDLILSDLENYEVRTCLKFDLSSIPEGSEISSAQIYLYYKSEAGVPNAGKQLDIHRNIQTWDESTVTWNDKPNIDAVATSTTTVGTEGSWRSFDVKNDVQSFIDNLQENYGWTIKFNTLVTSNEAEPSYDSNESAVNCPYLKVNGNGTYSQITTNFSSYNTVYYWNVSITDGTVSTNKTYHFATRDALMITNPYPANNSENISITQDTVNVTIEHPDGLTFNWTISGTYIDVNSSTGDTNGSKEANLTTLNYNIDVIWHVNATDGNWTNKTFRFSTQTNNTPVHSNLDPYNGKTEVALDIGLISFDISDLEGDTMNYSVTTSPSIGTGSGNDKTNGTYIIPISALSYSVTYYWTLKVTDGISWNNATYSFATKSSSENPPNIPTGPSPSDGATNRSVDLGTLSCSVSDPDGDILNVTFKWGNGTVIGYDYPVANGGRAEVNIPVLKFNTTYEWYAIANDSADEAQSAVWDFTTYEKSTEITLTPTSYNFGTVAFDSSKESITITVNNTGEAPITKIELKASDMQDINMFMTWTIGSVPNIAKYAMKYYTDAKGTWSALSDSYTDINETAESGYEISFKLKIFTPTLSTFKEKMYGTLTVKYTGCIARKVEFGFSLNPRVISNQTTAELNLTTADFLSGGIIDSGMFYISIPDNMSVNTTINIPSTYIGRSWFFWDKEYTLESKKVYGITSSWSFKAVATKGSLDSFRIDVDDFDDYCAFVIVPNPGYFQNDEWWFGILNNPKDKFLKGELL